MPKPPTPRPAEVNAGASGGEVAHGCKFLPGGAQGGLDRGDLAEPALVFGLLEPVAEVGVDLFQPWYLSWVNPKERAPDASVFMRTWRSIVTAADAERDFPELRDSLHLSSRQGRSRDFSPRAGCCFGEWEVFAGRVRPWTRRGCRISTGEFCWRCTKRASRLVVGPGGGIGWPSDSRFFILTCARRSKGAGRSLLSWPTAIPQSGAGRRPTADSGKNRRLVACSNVRPATNSRSPGSMRRWRCLSSTPAG